MPKWILITLAIGGYLGMWILTAWLLMRWDNGYTDPTIAAIGGFLWPAMLTSLIVLSPFLLVGYIVEHMPTRTDGEDGDEDDQAFACLNDDEDDLAAAEDVLGAEE